MSDALASEAITSLQEAPWEVRLASKLLHERHASDLLTRKEVLMQSVTLLYLFNAFNFLFNGLELRTI